MQKQSRAYYREFRRDTPDKFRLGQNGRHFGDDTFKRIMLKEMVCHLCIKKSLKFIPEREGANNQDIRAAFTNID